MVNRDKLFQDGCREVEFGAPVSVGDEFSAKYVTFPATAGAISSSSMQQRLMCIRFLSNERK